ncbi:hypothetical protein BGZ91_009607 [Linnemannia elongata]|nr:hypothetical protein BGZ91_009607 [Linnemannia elongata]
MRTTTSGRAFAKGIFDLFSTLMVSLPIENHKILFRNYPNSFTAEEAIANLGGLQFIQSNRDTDPKDPTRIITHVVTTQFSLSRDMAKNLCQTFMDARLFESASDATKREFQNKGIYQVTPKGAHILAKFVHRNTLPVEETRHITSNATPNLVYLERADDEDAIILTQKQVDLIFKRFAGPEPNMSRHANDPPSNSSSPGGRDRVHSVPDLCNGIEVKDQQHNYDVYKHTFYGKAAVEWLLDYTTVISKEEAICICQEMVTGGYIEQIGEDRNGSQLFRTGNYALYHLTETGRAVAGWKSLTGSRGSSINNDWMDERNATSGKNGGETKPLSVQFKLTANTVARLPISTERDNRRSMDENSIATTTATQYSEETGRGSMRRLSQILNDPAFQLSLSEAGAMSAYAPSSAGRDVADLGSVAGGSPAMSSSQSMTSNTTRLNIILKNSTLRDLFKNFLKQNICEENLSFYLEVIDYKSRFNSLINSTRAYNPSLAGQDYPPTLRELEKQICTQAFAIFETYLVAHAPREVNLPSHMRLDITAYMQAVVQNMASAPFDRQGVSPLTPGSPPGETLDGDRTYQELIHILPKTSSTTVPSSSSSSYPAPSSPPTAAEFGGSIPRSRSSTGIGLPPKYGSRYSASSSSSSGGSILGHSNNQYLWASSRHRSVSNSGPLPSNGVTSGSSHGNRSSVISSQGLDYPSYAESNTASKQQLQQPQHNSLQQRQSAGSSASLMEIYAQQQQLQQYSNQRAQLSPTQVQQMYIMRNSRSNPSLTSAATAVTASSPTTAAGTPGAASLPGVIETVSTKSDATISGHGMTQSPLSPKEVPSSSMPLTAAGQVTVMFESTSFSVQDPSHPNYIGNKSSPTSPTTPTGAGSAASFPLLVSTASSLSPTSTGAPSASFPGNYPGSATPNNNVYNGGNKKLNAA